MKFGPAFQRCLSGASLPYLRLAMIDCAALNRSHRSGLMDGSLLDCWYSFGYRTFVSPFHELHGVSHRSGSLGAE